MKKGRIGKFLYVCRYSHLPLCGREVGIWNQHVGAQIRFLRTFN